MNYHKITKYDVANGPGIRTVLWTSGCVHHCRGCHNPETWSPKSGIPFTQSTINEILESLDYPYIDGLTLSGGDPLYSTSRDDIDNLLQIIKSHYPDKSVWLYTGYLWEDLLNSIYNKSDRDVVLSILSNVDVLVDGRFDINKKDISLPYCGSSNQRLIDVQRSLDTGEVVLYEVDN